MHLIVVLVNKKGNITEKNKINHEKGYAKFV